jgi:DNA repair exonuclease SbcCD nuclease subunit
MRYCLISDAHLSLHDRLGTGDSRLKQKMNIYARAILCACKTGCDAIVELGDTFDRINPPDVLRYAYVSVVEQAIHRGMRWIRIVGNHETTGDKYTVAGLDVSLLANNKYVVVVEPYVLQDSDSRILCIPEVSNVAIAAALKKYSAKICPFIFGHFSVRGAKYSSGMVEKMGIPFSLLSSYRGVFLGHIHKRQIMRGKIHYIGCMARADFGDADVPTGYCVVDTKLNTVKYYPLSDIKLISVQIEESKHNAKYDMSCLLPDVDMRAAVIKIVYVGSREWLNGLPISDIRAVCLTQKNAAKLFIEYTKVSDVTITADIQAGNVKDMNIANLIRARAGKNTALRDAGLKYYHDGLQY